jgi:hypothetical protein
MFEGGRRGAVSARSRHELATQWQAARVLFVEAPETAVQRADELARTALEQAGYTVEGPTAPPFDDMVLAYRAAHGIARLSARGGATRRDLAHAMVHFGALIGDLIAEPADAPISRDTGT